MSADTNLSNQRAFFNADISAPAFKKHLIRNSLLREVMRSPKKLILIQAPPGYGKTSFMKQIMDAVASPSLWLNIRQSDNDPMNLLHKFNSALALASVSGEDEDDPVTGVSVHQTSGFSSSSISLWTRSLIEHMNKHPKLFIFLNDADFLDTDDATAVINLLLQASHAGIRLCLTSSSNVHVSYSHLLIENQVTEVTQDDLCFSRQDIQAMFALYQGPELNDETAKQLT